MNKIEKLIAKLCPNGVEYKRLGEIIHSINTGLNPRKFFKLNPPNAENFYITVREMVEHKIVISPKTDKINAEALELCLKRSKLEKNDILFSGTGTIGEVVTLSEKPTNFAIKEGIYAIKPNTEMIFPKFLMYYFKSKGAREQIKNMSFGGTVKSISMGDTQKILVPIPPLEIQEEIVKILDNFSELTTELTTELTARKKQYEYYRNTLLDFGDENNPKDGIEYRAIKDIASYRRGSFPQPYTNKQWYGGNDAKPFVQVADVGVDFKLVKTTKICISKIAQTMSVFVPRGTVIVTLQGTIGRVAITQYDAFVDRTIAIFQKYKISINKRFFAFALSQKFKNEKEKARGGTIKTITKEEFSEFKIPIPSLETQQRIVDILDRFEALTSDYQEGLPAEIEARTKQYEYYRDKLLDFKELESENV